MTDPTGSGPGSPQTDVAQSGQKSSAPARRGRWMLVLAVVALVVAVGAAALAIGQSGEIDDLRSERDDRREIALVASQFAATYMTYDFEDVDATNDALDPLVTEAFAAAFSAQREPLRDSFAAIETSTVATTDEVFVGDIEGNRARALVVVDIELTSSASGTQELEDFSIVLDLVREGGRWRVDRQRPAPQPDVSGGTAATTTTVPPTTAP